MAKNVLMRKRVDQEVERVEVDAVTLDFLQECVGGFVEPVYIAGGEVIMLVNEEGWLKNLPVNFYMNGYSVVGDVVFCSSAVVNEYGEQDFVGLDAKKQKIVLDFLSAFPES